MIKIPTDRIGVLIGSDGSVKKIIEKESTGRLIIDSKTGEVELTDVKDPLKGMRGMDVIKAIARGFSPERAFSLFEDDMLFLDIIDLSEYASTPKALERIKGRIIGSKGRTRETIENYTNTKISVYGKTVSLIGYPEGIRAARNAIGMLIRGSPHGAVYRFLEKRRMDTEYY